jgi:hypothetical protein
LLHGFPGSAFGIFFGNLCGGKGVGVEPGERVTDFFDICGGMLGREFGGKSEVNLVAERFR